MTTPILSPKKTETRLADYEPSNGYEPSLFRVALSW